MEDKVDGRLFAPIENKKVLEPGFLNFLKNDKITNADEKMNSFQFNKYDYQGESVTGGTFASTITSSTQSFETCAYSNSSYPPPRELPHYDDEKLHHDLSPSPELQMDRITNTHYTKSSKRLEKVKYQRNRSKEESLPPKNPPRALPIHSRLAESHTMNSMMRQSKGRMINNEKQYQFEKQPFYTTISKSNSFSDLTTYSNSSCSPKDTSSISNKVSSSIFNRLAATETFSTSCRRKSKPERSKITKPFYTTVGSSNPARSEKLTAKSRSQNSLGLADSSRRRRMRSMSPTMKYKERYDQSSFCRNSLELETSDENPREICKSSHRQKQNQQSVFDRLLKTGTISSMQNHQKSFMYKENEKTFHECTKTALLRDFKGSTYVSVSKGPPVNKSIIGTIVNCGSETLG